MRRERATSTVNGDGGNARPRRLREPPGFPDWMMAVVPRRFPFIAQVPHDKRIVMCHCRWGTRLYTSGKATITT